MKSTWLDMHGGNKLVLSPDIYHELLHEVCACGSRWLSSHWMLPIFWSTWMLMLRQHSQHPFQVAYDTCVLREGFGGNCNCVSFVGGVRISVRSFCLWTQLPTVTTDSTFRSKKEQDNGKKFCLRTLSNPLQTFCWWGPGGLISILTVHD